MQPATQNLRQPATPTSETSSAAPALVSKRARNLILAIVTGALALGLSYGIGWAEGAAKTAALKQHAVQQQVGHEKSADRLRERLDQMEARSRLLEARRLLHRSSMALDLDNFGTARDHLAKAHQLVSAAKPVPGSPLSDFRDALASVQLGVTADPMPQRLELTQLAAKFDELLSR